MRYVTEQNQPRAQKRFDKQKNNVANTEYRRTACFLGNARNAQTTKPMVASESSDVIMR